MRIRTAFILFSSSLSSWLLLSPGSLPAPYVWKNGWFYDQKYLATESLDDHWNKGLKSLQEQQWEEALLQFKIVHTSFPDSSQAKEAHYYMGIALYQLDDVGVANQQFTEYLEVENNPQFYEEVFRYKLQIAQRLKNGELRRPFGSEKLPKIMPAQDTALEIFEEISTSLPNHDLAAQALQEKAQMLVEREEFDEAIDTYLTLTRRFQKSEFAIAGYKGINEVYLKQLQLEANNPDLLPLAELNIQKFQVEFPQESSIEEEWSTLNQMKETAASGLFDIGQFYERTKKPGASILYYNMAITRYPETNIAKLCRERLKEISPDENTH